MPGCHLPVLTADVTPERTFRGPSRPNAQTDAWARPVDQARCYSLPIEFASWRGVRRADIMFHRS